MERLENMRDGLANWAISHPFLATFVAITSIAFTYFVRKKFYAKKEQSSFKRRERKDLISSIVVSSASDALAKAVEDGVLYQFEADKASKTLNWAFGNKAIALRKALFKGEPANKGGSSEEKKARASKKERLGDIMKKSRIG